MRIITEHPAMTPKCRIHIVCPRHPESRMATWVELPDGYDYWEQPNPGVETWTEEFVTAEPVSLDVKTLARLNQLGIRPPDGSDPNGREHQLLAFSCPRPSCNYSPKLDSARLTETLRKIAAGGIPEITVTNIDQPSWRPA